MKRIILLFILPTLAFAAAPQTRDHLTEGEGDLVRATQLIDERIDVFIRAADRRLLVLTNPAATQKKKEEETWGPLPKGTRVELLQDYKRILEEAEEKLDDAYTRNQKDEAVAKALKKFKTAAERQIAQMRAFAPQLTDPKEQRALLEAIDEATLVTRGSTQ